MTCKPTLCRVTVKNDKVKWSNSSFVSAINPRGDPRTSGKALNCFCSFATEMFHLGSMYIRVMNCAERLSGMVLKRDFFSGLDHRLLLGRLRRLGKLGHTDNLSKS